MKAIVLTEKDIEFEFRFKPGKIWLQRVGILPLYNLFLSGVTLIAVL